MKLALKKTPSKSLFGKIFGQLIKWRLVSTYCHGGIVIGNLVYHCNYDHGLYASEFNQDGWEFYDVPAADDAQALKLFEDMQGVKYDWFGILGFILPFKLQRKEKLYCFEWCYLCMTGNPPACRVTPEVLLAITYR
jgi:hypothetical protein